MITILRQEINRFGESEVNYTLWMEGKDNMLNVTLCNKPIVAAIVKKASGG
jgi:hypothetical protein